MFGNYQKFRFWCQKVLPLVYDDSISYYETLCKVVKVLNELITGINELPEYIQQIIDEKFTTEVLEELLKDFMEGLQNAISANNEGKNNTSDNDYSAGQMLWLDNKLYLVVRDIEEGDRFVIGGANPNLVLKSFEDEFNTFTGKIKNVISTNDEGINANATQTWAVGTWLWWGDELYKVTREIVEGTTFIFSGDNTNMVKVHIMDVIGDMSDLTTDETSNIVSALNSLVDNIGGLDNLDTEAKQTIVAAITEVNTNNGNLATVVGDLLDLTTTDKSSIVNAINEINDYNTPKVESWYLSIANMVTLGADNTGEEYVDDIFEAALDNYDAIYFPSGTYKWKEQHDINSKKIVGDNAIFISDSFGLNAGDYNQYGGFDSDYPQMLWNVTGEGSYISGFKFKTDAGGIVIRADYCTIRDCYFDTRATITGSTGYYAITIRDCEGITVDNCICDMLDGNNRDGIHIEGNSYNINISNCIILAGDDGIALNALEGAGGSIIHVNITNCIIGGYGMRFFGNADTPISDVNVSNCILRVTSRNMDSGAVRFSNTLNTLGGTPIGGDFIVSGIKFDNCQFTGDKATDVSFYTLNTKGHVAISNSQFTHNFYIDSATAGSTINISIDNCVFSGTQLNAALDTGNCYMNVSQSEIAIINKLGDGNFTAKFMDCDIATTIDISGGGSNNIKLIDCLLGMASVNMLTGTYEIKNCTVPSNFVITNGAGYYFVDNLLGIGVNSAFSAPSSAARIAGNVIVSALPSPTGQLDGDSLLYNNGVYPEKYFIKNGGWAKYFIGVPQTMADLTNAPTATDFNNLLAKLKATGIFY